ncbi:hypothetical protein ACFZCY_41550 [Streptomyces sp. NPDC007983]|uniref:hypothetical protein n=1 Tax=Streptomyces sp. NPDC007983 TaxID=3364800 RepID=UPI0036E37E07
MARYARDEARDWARENLVGVVNCTIPSFTADLRAINEKAIRHDTRLAIEHGFMGTLGVSEVSIQLPEYLDFLRVIKDEAGDRLLLRRSTTTPRPSATRRTSASCSSRCTCGASARASTRPTSPYD